ncbi:homeobox protein siamois-like [Dendropsophus ebraccatus]|uniref:homeobox protein siamois-like n=1 Tax=Dendropsophus ebraccatus TaxID=150705 RepID=UPI0038313046
MLEASLHQKNLKRSVMDSELEQVLCTVLSLEEDYPRLSPPMRNQENPSSHFYTLIDFSSAMEAPGCLHPSDILQEAACDLYSMIGLQEDLPSIMPGVPAPAEPGADRQIKPLKRKYSDDSQDGCKKPRVEMYTRETMTSGAHSRKKTIFSTEQTKFLQNQFEFNPYPDFVQRCEISQMTGIPEPRIQVWFQNRRARHPPRTNRSLGNRKRLQ